MDYQFLAGTPLFRGISPSDIEEMSHCLHFRTARYERNDVIYLSGSTDVDIGLVLSGCVQVESNDLWGTKSILNMVEAGGVFAEAYACCPGETMMVDVVAARDCEILFIRSRNVFQLCPSPCSRHADIIRNLVTVSARKNIRLSQRILDTSPKTIRGRLLSYLSRECALQGSRDITIPFDRQQLADYLSVERSALSKELGKMKADGLLDYKKNRFRLSADDMQP